MRISKSKRNKKNVRKSIRRIDKKDKKDKKTTRPPTRKSRKSLVRKSPLKKNVPKNPSPVKNTKKTRKSKKPSPVKKISPIRNVNSIRKRNVKSVKNVKKREKAVKTPNDDILNFLKERGYTLGKFLGEGASSVAYEVFKNGQKHVLKFFHTSKTYSYGNEYGILKKAGELVDYPPSYKFLIIKYCGNPMSSYPRPFPLMSINQAMISLLESIDKLHSNGLVHCDIKPDNICVSDDEKSLRLMDFGNAKFITKSYEFPLLKSTANKNDRETIKTINEFRQSGLDISNLGGRGIVGNMYWPLEAFLNFSTQFPPYPHYDVESAALSIWIMYLEPSENLPWSIYEYKKENRENIIRSRLESQCPFPIVQDVIEAAWDGKKMNLKELIKQLKKKYIN